MAIQLGSVLLDACVLAVVMREDTYGYKLTQEVKQIMDVSESTLYPVLRRLQKDGYDPNAVLAAEPRAKRVVESLVDGTFSDGGTGMFRELYASLTEGASWHKPDHYFLMRDFIEYCDARLAVNRDYRDARAFAAKCVRNVANAGVFSSDRTILEYARDIWHV